MRIAYVSETYPPEVNGVALSVERAVRYLREHGHEVELIRPRQRGESPSDTRHEWRTAGFPLPMYPDLRCGLAFTGTLNRRFARNPPQVVHIATPGPLGRAALKAARQRGIPVTSDFRTNFHSYCRYYRLGFLTPLVSGYLRNFHNAAQRTFVPSRSVQSELSATGFQHLDLVGRGVDTDLFSPAMRSRTLRAAWGAVQDDQPVLLYVGRLAREKNVLLALRAFEIVYHLRPMTRMVVVGDGPLRTQLQTAFPMVHFAGIQRGEDLARHYASADLFVFPSESETFGNVTLEAMSSGLPVIAFNVAAAADHIANESNGVLVAPGNHNGFMEAVCRKAAIDRELLVPMRARAREAVLNLTWEKILGNFEALLVSAALAQPMERSHRVVMA